MKLRNFLIYIIVAIMGAVFALAGYVMVFQKPQIALQQPQMKNDTHLTRFANPPVIRSEVPVDFTTVAEETVNGVVHVKVEVQGQTATDPFYEFFYGNRNQKSTPVVGFGSGVIISDDGYIVTNNHVVENADKIEIILNDKRTFTAELIGTDPNTDLALLKVKADNLHYVLLGNSDNVKLGQWVLAVGNPFNLTSTVTAGIVSAKGRNLGILGSNRYKIESFIQTDAAVNRGNSGGALVDTEGRLIGINSAIVSATGEYSGNSFAIPVNIVKKVVADLKEFGRVQRAVLGVSIQDVTSELAEEHDLNKLEGVYIAELTDGGAAEAAGMKPGDIILSVSGVDVNSVAELQEEFSKYRPGDEVSVEIKRKGKTKQYDIVLRNLEGGTSIVKTSDYLFGAKFDKLTKSDKEKYQISNGLIITDIKPGMLADLGFKKGYIIVRINNTKIASVSDIRRVSETGEEISSIQGITPDGMEFSYRLR
jgi:Do/DeqQ family serine protease